MEFPNGKLEQEYEKLLNHDKALHDLSLIPFSNDLYFGAIHQINHSLNTTQMPNKQPFTHSINHHENTTNLGFHHPPQNFNSSLNSSSIVPHPTQIHGFSSRNFNYYLSSSNTLIPSSTPPPNFNHGLTSPSTAYVSPTENFNHGQTPSNFAPSPPQNEFSFTASNLNSSYLSSSQPTPFPTPTLNPSATINEPMASSSPIFSGN